MTEKSLEEIRNIRLHKIEELKKLEIYPYPSKVKGNPIKIVKAREKEGSDVEVVGRIFAWRAHGNSIFADLVDESGKIQIFFQKKNLEKDFSITKLLDIGDFIFVKGKIFKTQAGELTIDVYDFQLLTKSVRPLPSSWYGLKDVEERYRQRYVDLLINHEVKEVFKTRAKIINLFRKKLIDNDFVEVKTPSLQAIYGGATAKPFITHHNVLDIDLYLRISDELYLKRLIVGGFEKVFEFGTDFRNEGIDRWHNPEFTMLEFYWAYADYNDLMNFTENMISEIVKEIKGSYELTYADSKVDFKPPWKRISYKDAFLEHTGLDIDKIGSLEELKKNLGESVDLREANNLNDALDTVYKLRIRDKFVNPTYLMDHPYFMRPLAKRSKNSAVVESFQLVVAGAELINAYSELNDPQDQRGRWEEDMKRAAQGAKEYQVLDEDYIRALEYGMPPTAGWGLGIDRFTAILTNQHSLKDVILFPTLRTK